MSVSGKINSAGANLLAAMVKQLDQISKPWQQMPEREQQVVIFRLREAVEANVKALVKAMSTADFQSIPASVDSVTFKDGVKAVLKLAKGADSTHALADAQGGQVLIVLTTLDAYLDGIEHIKAVADQAELFEPHDSDETPSTIDENQNAVSERETASPDSGVPQFVFGLLQSVCVKIDLETVQSWTKEQLTVAAHWAGEYSKPRAEGEMCPVARPHWLPIPEPKAEASGESYSRTGEPNDQEFGSVEIPLENRAGETIVLEGDQATSAREADAQADWSEGADLGDRDTDDEELDEDEELDDERHEDAA